jgi:hypothetical protein
MAAQEKASAKSEYGAGKTKVHFIVLLEAVL